MVNEAIEIEEQPADSRRRPVTAQNTLVGVRQLPKI